MILSSLIAALTFVNFTNPLYESNSGPANQREWISMPAFEIHRPESFSSHWIGEYELWVKSGRWTANEPEADLETRCLVRIKLSHHDRLELLQNRSGIQKFRFPGGKIKLEAQMLTGELDGGEKFFWNQQFGKDSVLPSVIQEASFSFQMEKTPIPTSRRSGLFLQTIVNSEASGLMLINGGTHISHIWCQGPLMKMETIHRVFDAGDSSFFVSSILDR